MRSLRRRAPTGRAGAGRNRLALHHLLGAAGSSPAAAAAAVERFAERNPTTRDWAALAQRWAAVGDGGKEAALIDLLRRNPRREEARLRALSRNARASRRAADAGRASRSRVSTGA